ncbi:MAG: hypothetical protein ACRC76_14505, partial [Proteocatella sp.]
VPIPVIANGGMGSGEDFVNVVKYGRADAVAMGYVLHYDKMNVKAVKGYAEENSIKTRRI